MPASWECCERRHPFVSLAAPAQADFGIEWWLPDGQLVPTLTNRANYVHWINDLLALSSPEPASAGQGWWMSFSTGARTRRAHERRDLLQGT